MCALVTGVQTCALPISGSRDRSLVGSEGADDREEARQPALAAGAGDVALANVADARAGDACRGDAVVGADVDRADKARDLYPFVRSAERRVGNELVRTCSFRCAPYNSKKKKTIQ